MSKEEKRKNFMELYDHGMVLFDQGRLNWISRYCVKQRKAVLFKDLKDLECWKCGEYICNAGVCDPI